MFRAGEKYSLEELNARFADMPPPLAVDEARVEAARCLFCFDAPCTRACPTHIDVPRFIRQILHRDEIGAARTILDANIFGGSCARACPTEVLCEGACVDQMLMKAPVQIGRLQRFACDIAADAGRPVLRGRPADGQTGGRGRLGTGRAELRPRAAAARARRGRLRGPRRPGRPGYARDRRLQDLDRVRPGRDRADPRDRDRRSSSATASRATRSGRCSAEFDAVFLGIGLGRTAAAGDRGRGAGGRLGGARLHLPDPYAAVHRVRRGHARRGDRRRQHGDRRGDRRQAARGRDGNDRLSALRGPDPGVRLRVPAREVRRRPLRVVRPADPHHRRWTARPRASSSSGPSSRSRTSRSGRVRTVPGSHFVLAADMVVKALGQEPLAGLARRAARTAARTRARSSSIVPPVRRASPDSSPAATASGAAARSSTPSRTARSRRGASTPRCDEGIGNDRPVDRILRRQGPKPVLAGVGAADQLRVPGPPRLRRRLGRRGLEDARGRADRQRLVALRRRRLRRPKGDGTE